MNINSNKKQKKHEKETEFALALILKSFDTIYIISQASAILHHGTTK